MKTRDAGEGTSLKQGEAGAGEFSLKEKLLSTSLSGDSISLSPIWMSLLILCDKGGRFEGEGSLGEVGKVKGAFFHFESILVRLEQPTGVGRRLEQPGVMTHFWGEEEKTWPGQFGGALGAGSFSAASSEKQFS